MNYFLTYYRILKEITAAMKTLNLQTQFTGNLLHVQDQLYFYALQLTENQDDAKDLVQETSYKALKNRKKLNNDKNIRAWLYTILRNTYINFLRSGHNRQIKIDKSDFNQLLINTPASSDESPEELLIKKELHEIINLLPVVYGQPLQMFISGFSYREISDEMKIPIGTVKSRIHLGKKKIKRAYLH